MSGGSKSFRRRPLFRAMSDLSGSHLEDYVGIFNKRLTRRMEACRLQLLQTSNSSSTTNGLDESQRALPSIITGGIKVNFALKRPIKVLNCVQIGQHVREVFITQFKFSRKSTIIIPASSSETTMDLLNRLFDRFNILPSSAQNLALYEREISIAQQDIYYRKLDKNEIPLELSLIWSLNQEKKSLVLTDHDPNSKGLSKLDMQQLDQKLATLNHEEEMVIESTRKSFMAVKSALEEAKRQLDKPT